MKFILVTMGALFKTNKVFQQTNSREKFKKQFNAYAAKKNVSFN